MYSTGYNLQKEAHAGGRWIQAVVNALVEVETPVPCSAGTCNPFNTI
jgi:hypothetical protein